MPCVLVVGLEGEPYHMLEGRAELTSVLGTNFLSCDEGAFG